MQPKISVIIPTYKRAQMVCECIASVLRSDYTNFEICVVDDASPDETQQAIQKQFHANPKVRYVRNEQNQCSAFSKNRGAAMATGDWLLFLDDDNLVQPDMLSALAKGMDTVPDCGLIAPLSIHHLKGKEDRIWNMGASFNPWTSQPKDRMPGVPLRIAETAIDRPYYDTTYSPNAFMIPKLIFEQVGGFDAKLGIMFEESDLGWRIGKMGKGRYQRILWPSARTFHLGFRDPTSCSALRSLGIETTQRSFFLARNRILFAKRHFPLFGCLSVLFLFAPLSALYYAAVALKNKNPAIAFAYLRGTITGYFCRNSAI